MNIYLVRHGEAVSEKLDPKRPLTSSGREEVQRIGRLAAAKNVKVSAIFHSGILRAKQTAEILAEHLQFNWRMCNSFPVYCRRTIQLSSKPSLKPRSVPSFWWAIFPI